MISLVVSLEMPCPKTINFLSTLWRNNNLKLPLFYLFLFRLLCCLISLQKYQQQCEKNDAKLHIKCKTLPHCAAPIVDKCLETEVTRSSRDFRWIPYFSTNQLKRSNF